MHASLQALRGLRHPAWYSLLFLPLLPLITQASRSEGLASAGLLEHTLMLVLLGGAGALGIPALLDRLSWSFRKEAEQLRGAWLSALFVAQVPLLITEDPLIFVASCAFLAAIPFGAEYQQRTMSALLSQPVPRELVWSSKMAVLAFALLSHWAFYLVARNSLGSPTSPALSVGLLIAGLAAWGTTPWWTLRTRALLPGLVFSLTAPLLFLALLALLADVVFELNWFQDFSRVQQQVEAFLLWVCAPAYALWGAWASRRHWSRLEATESSASDAGVALAPAWGRWLSPRVQSHRPLRNLIAKELRLQTVTWIATGITLAMAGALAALRWISVSSGGMSLFTLEYANGCLGLFALVSVLVAGATAIAEERRLGTLDAQVLSPWSRAAQWWMKLGVVVIAHALVMVALCTGFGWAGASFNAFLVLIALGVLAITLFASSGAPNTLRALLFAILLISSIAFSLILTGNLGDQAVRQNHRETFDSMANDPASWTATAAQLGNAGIDALAVPTPEIDWLLGIAGGVAAILAFSFAWQNFKCPAQARARFRIQAFVALGCVVGLSALSYQWVNFASHRTQRADALSEALEYARWDATLSPAERRLWRATAGDAILNSKAQSFVIATPVPDASGNPASDAGTARDASKYTFSHEAFRFPLSPADKERLIRQGGIAESLREELRGETSLPPVTPPPFGPDIISRGPHGAVLDLDRSMMRRYGLFIPLPNPASNAPSTKVSTEPAPR